MTVPPRTGREGAGYLPRFAECATYRSRGSAGGAGENKMCALPEPFEKPEKKQSPTESPHFFLFHSLLCCCRPLCVCVVETHGFLKARGNREVGVGTGGGEPGRGERICAHNAPQALPLSHPPESTPLPRARPWTLAHSRKGTGCRRHHRTARVPGFPRLPLPASVSSSVMWARPPPQGMKRRQSRPPTVPSSASAAGWPLHREVRRLF